MASSPPLPAVLALADDLSGAAEAARALGGPVRLSLTAQGGGVAPAHDLVVDLNTRHLPPADAADAVRSALRCRSSYGLLYKKIDSQLRGNVSAEAVAYAEGARALVVAPALPAARRTVTGGVVHVAGVPLHETSGWRAERAAPPRSVAQAFSGLPVRTIPLEVVRSGPGRLEGELKRAAADGCHPAPDAETDADLDAVVAAALRLGPGFRLLGSGGLAGALGRALARPAVPAPVPPPAHEATPLLVVAGTAEPGAVRQIARLEALGMRHHPLRPGELMSGAVTVPTGIAATDTVLSIDGSAGLHPAGGRVLSAALAALAAAWPGRPDLVLTGGETARATLDALGVRELEPVGEIHHGAVRSRTPDGRSVVTRPGSYGAEDSLLRIATALRPHLATTGPRTLPAQPAS